MTFNQHQLPAPLNKYIESIFHFKDFMPDHSIERVVPIGHIFLLFELDGFPRNTFDNTTLKPNNTFTKAWISGMHRHYISISAHENSEMFVIQFNASGLYPFLHQSVEKLTEKIVPAEVIFGKEIHRIRNKFLLLKTSQEKFQAAEHWLNQRFDITQTPPQELVTIIHQLQKEPISNFSKVTRSYPYSQKHLIAQFKKYVGLTPKYYHRILRFNEILQKIRQQQNIAWSDIAYHCGFADQSHFIKEFKHFSGLNPQKFIQKDFHLEEPNFFPLDKEEK